MGKCDEFGWGGGSNGSMCGSGGRWIRVLIREGKLPKACGRGAVASEYNRVIVRDGDGGGIKSDRASGITKLAHGEQGGSG